MHQNIEIKAKCDNPQKIRDILKSLNADFKGIDKQTDTYFNVKNGRLKFREGNIENYLIFYNRQNISGPKQSDVILYKTQTDSEIKRILTESNGILAVVKKKREIYYVENVKFHIDEVDNLGSFVEIEAINFNNISTEELLKQCNYYLNVFEINQSQLISESYSDLIFKNNTE